MAKKLINNFIVCWV